MKDALWVFLALMCGTAVFLLGSLAVIAFFGGIKWPKMAR